MLGRGGRGAGGKGVGEKGGRGDGAGGQGGLENCGTFHNALKKTLLRRT